MKLEGSLNISGLTGTTVLGDDCGLAMKGVIRVGVPEHQGRASHAGDGDGIIGGRTPADGETPCSKPVTATIPVRAGKPELALDTEMEMVSANPAEGLSFSRGRSGAAVGNNDGRRLAGELFGRAGDPYKYGRACQSRNVQRAYIRHGSQRGRDLDACDRQYGCERIPGKDASVPLCCLRYDACQTVGASFRMGTATLTGSPAN